MRQLSPEKCQQLAVSVMDAAAYDSLLADAKNAGGDVEALQALFETRLEHFRTPAKPRKGCHPHTHTAFLVLEALAIPQEKIMETIPNLPVNMSGYRQGLFHSLKLRTEAEYDAGADRRYHKPAAQKSALRASSEPHKRLTDPASVDLIAFVRQSHAGGWPSAQIAKRSRVDIADIKHLLGALKLADHPPLVSDHVVADPKEIAKNLDPSGSNDDIKKILAQAYPLYLIPGNGAFCNPDREAAILALYFADFWRKHIEELLDAENIHHLLHQNGLKPATLANIECKTPCQDIAAQLQTTSSDRQRRAILDAACPYWQANHAPENLHRNAALKSMHAAGFCSYVMADIFSHGEYNTNWVTRELKRLGLADHPLPKAGDVQIAPDLIAALAKSDAPDQARATLRQFLPDCFRRFGFETSPYCVAAIAAMLQVDKSDHFIRSVLQSKVYRHKVEFAMARELRASRLPPRLPLPELVEAFKKAADVTQVHAILARECPDWKKKKGNAFSDDNIRALQAFNLAGYTLSDVQLVLGAYAGSDARLNKYGIKSGSPRFRS